MNLNYFVFNPSRLDIHNRFTTMAKISPMTHFDAISGKYARTDKVYTRVRKFDNQIIGVALKHPATNLPPTEGQQTAQQKMKAVQAKVTAALADASQRAQYMVKWKSQTKYKTLRGYVFAQKYAKP